MDRNTCFVYYFTMQLYYDPNIRILIINRKPLPSWHSDDFRVSFWRLYWNSKPGALIRYRQETVELTPDRIVLVPPNTPISQRLTYGAPQQFFAHFFADAPFDHLNPKIYVFKAEPHMLKTIKSVPLDATESISACTTGATLLVRGLINSLLARIPEADFKSLHIPAQLAENMAFIETHIRQAVSNREIARHLGLSVNTMLRRYQRELGMSPQKYLRQRRIERACALLHDPQRSIKQVAEETGFCDRYYFTRMFKKLQGVTPRQYRLRFE